MSVPETEQNQPATDGPTARESPGDADRAGASTLPRIGQVSGSRAWLTRRARPLWIVLLVVGITIGCFGAITDRIIVPVRIVMVLAGLVVAYVGASRLGRGIFGRRFDLTFYLSAAWLVGLIVVAAIAPLLPLPEWVDVAGTLDAPSYAGIDLLSAHPLGTNNYGLDLLARSVYGARTSLIVALSAVAIGTALGGAIGIAAGYFRKATDRVVTVLTNAVLAVPPLILLIAIATVLEPNLRNIAIALSLLTIPSMIRLARANTLAFSEREFVVMAQAMGASRLRVMVRELLPNVLLPMLSLAMVMISVLIVAESSLSFLGLGVPPPEPTWGNMIAEGKGNVFAQHPQIVLVPGVFLFLTVFAFNLVGEKARNRWDARSGQL